MKRRAILRWSRELGIALAIAFGTVVFCDAQMSDFPHWKGLKSLPTQAQVVDSTNVYGLREVEIRVRIKMLLPGDVSFRLELPLEFEEYGNEEYGDDLMSPETEIKGRAADEEVGVAYSVIAPPEGKWHLSCTVEYWPHESVADTTLEIPVLGLNSIPIYLSMKDGLVSHVGYDSDPDRSIGNWEPTIPPSDIPAAPDSAWIADDRLYWRTVEGVDGYRLYCRRWVPPIPADWWEYCDTILQPEDPPEVLFSELGARTPDHRERLWGVTSLRLIYGVVVESPMTESTVRTAIRRRTWGQMKGEI